MLKMAFRNIIKAPFFSILPPVVCVCPTYFIRGSHLFHQLNKWLYSLIILCFYVQWPPRLLRRCSSHAFGPDTPHIVITYSRLHSEMLQRGSIFLSRYLARRFFRSAFYYCWFLFGSRADENSCCMSQPEIQSTSNFGAYEISASKPKLSKRKIVSAVCSS